MSGDLVESHCPRQAARGAIAQLGERIVRNDEVVGSSPTSSTILSTTCGISSCIASGFVSLFASWPLAAHPDSGFSGMT